MRYLTKIKLFILLASLPLLAFHCNPSEPVDPDIPIYSYREPIVNPPDDFKISFDLTQIGDKVATVTFSSDAVWEIMNTGDSRAKFWIQNQNGDINAIPSTFKAGLKGNTPYIFAANNNNYTDIKDFFCRVTKQADNYQDFPTKF